MRGPARNALDRGHELEELADPHPVIQRGILGHVARVVSGRMFRDIDTADAYGTGGGPEIASEDAQDRALARAVGSEQADDFPLFDGEGYATHSKAGAIALHKALDDNNVRLRHRITAFSYRGRAVPRRRGPFTHEQVLFDGLIRRILANAYAPCTPRRHAP